MAFAMSSWEASNHSQSRRPVFAELPCDKRSCEWPVGPRTKAGEQSDWALSCQGTESVELGEPLLPPQPLAWAEG